MSYSLQANPAPLRTTVLRLAGPRRALVGLSSGAGQSILGGLVGRPFFDRENVFCGLNPHYWAWNCFLARNVVGSEIFISHELKLIVHGIFARSIQSGR